MVVVRIVQCLSNTRLLTEYFTKGEYLYDINTTQTFGMAGCIAVDYGDLISEMWSAASGVSALPPRRLKTTLGRYKPQVRAAPINQWCRLFAV